MPVARTLTLLLTFLFIGVANAQDAETSSQPAVLITGASSGIGRLTTEVLARSGTFVYAGARKQADIDALNALDNVEAVRLDVTKDDEIAAAVDQVRRGGRGLHAIVNNAGVAVLGPLVEIPQSDLDLTLNVNVIGPWRITKAFLPLLLESKGRVINISSVSGIQANMLFGTYSMSKHALEAYNDVLELELAPFGIKVIAVEPGAFNSSMGRNAIAVMEERGLSVENSIYQNIPWDVISSTMKSERLGGRVGEEWPDPDAVALAVQDALFNESPKAHYMVTSSQSVSELTVRKAIEELVRYNEGHEYTFSRDDLVQMLDEELSGSRNASDLTRFGDGDEMSQQ